MKGHRAARLALAALAALTSGTAARAMDIHVPADQPTIQQAIAAAADGDRVLVDPGTYVENIDFAGKDIEVSSTGGADLTSIDGSGVDVVVKFHGGETSAAVLSGFTLRNGHNTATFDGGGISVVGASPTITRNTITGNVGCNGGGIHVESSTAIVISRNHVVGNMATCEYGGGMAIAGPVEAVITNNTIESNRSNARGGGIALTGGAGRARVEGNQIRRNKVPAEGGGIFTTIDRLTLRDNVITENRGGGIEIDPVTTTHRSTVINNTLADNWFAELRFVTTFGRLFAYNNIIRTSHAPQTIGCQVTRHAKAFFSHNLIHSDTRKGEIGNCDIHDALVTDDPQFVGGTGRHPYWLASGSPAIDAGDNDAAGNDKRDAGGRTRIVNGAVDLGAFEFGGD
jgi:hypothetical protein